MISDPSSWFKGPFWGDDARKPQEPGCRNRARQLVRTLAPILPDGCVAAVRKPYIHRARLMVQAAKLVSRGRRVWMHARLRPARRWPCPVHLRQSLANAGIAAPAIDDICTAIRMDRSFPAAHCELHRLLQEYHLFDQIDRAWATTFPRLSLLRWRREVVVLCDDHQEARAASRGMKWLFKEALIVQSYAPQIGIRDLTHQTGIFDGLTATAHDGGLRWHLGERAWNTLDRLLELAAAKPDPYRAICRAVPTWIAWVGPAYPNLDLEASLHRVMSALRRAGLREMPTEFGLSLIWHASYLTWKEACERELGEMR